MCNADGFIFWLGTTSTLTQQRMNIAAIMLSDRSLKSAAVALKRPLL
jgi:hypothetical protein